MSERIEAATAETTGLWHSAGAAHLGLVLCMLSWGGMTPAFWVLLKSWDAWGLSALRYFVAVPPMILLLRWREGPAALHASVSPWRLAMLGGVGIAGLATLYTLGIAYSNPVSAIVAQASGPLIGVGVARLVARTTMPPGIVSSLVLVTLGALLTMAHELDGGAGFRGGELLILAGAACWAWYSIACQRWLPGWSQLRVTTLTIIPGGLILWLVYGIVALAGVARDPLAAATPAAAALLILIALTSTCLGIMLWHNGVTRLGLPTASLYLNLAPVFAVLLALLLGVVPSWQQLVGGVLVLAGVMQIRLRQRH